MPEFLTERNWEEDFLNTKIWYIGIPADRDTDEWTLQRERIMPLDDILFAFCASPWIKLAPATELEFVKYARNCFLAVKVAYFNEIASFATKLELDYDKIRRLVVDDSRIGESHTFVPGPDGKYGFGGACLPKDIKAFDVEFEKAGVDDPILKAAIKRNQTDRE